MNNHPNAWNKKTLDERDEYWLKYEIRNRVNVSITRAKKQNKYPPWANKEEIVKIYTQAVLMEKETGNKYVVDHIIPLCGENVSGLHVHNNLQIISQLENSMKGNKY